MDNQNQKEIMTPPATIANLPEAPEYTLARLCIARLREAGTLPEGVLYEEPFSHAEQSHLLDAAANQYGGVVAVVPQLLRDDHPQATSGVLTVRLAVAVLVTPNVSDMPAQEVASRLMAAIVRALYRWTPEGAGIPYAAVRLEGVEELMTAQYEGLENLIGLALTISKGMLYA